MALTMWTTSATGIAGWWASSGMNVVPVDRSVSRSDPATTGTRDRATRTIGTRQVGVRGRVAGVGCAVRVVVMSEAPQTCRGPRG